MKYTDIPADDVLAALARAFPDLIFIIDEDGRYRAALGGTDRSKYHDPQSLPQLIGLRFHDVMPAALADLMLAAVHEALDGGKLHTITYSLNESEIPGYADKPGPKDVQWFEARLSPMCSDASRSVVALVYNITERMRAEAHLARLARTDDLTRLGNRRAFLERAADMVGTARRYGHALTLAMIDIDHFKRINDRHGHETGDAVLRDYAAIIDGQLRETDFLARIGGEEFAVLLAFTAPDQAREVIERLCATMRGTVFRHAGNELAVTMSAGLAGCRMEDADNALSAMLRRADKALYEAKRLGRDRVVVDAS